MISALNDENKEDKQLTINKGLDLNSSNLNLITSQDIQEYTKHLKETKIIKTIKDVNVSSQITEVQETSNKLMKNAKETMGGMGFFFGKSK